MKWIELKPKNYFPNRQNNYTRSGARLFRLNAVIEEAGRTNASQMTCLCGFFNEKEDNYVGFLRYFTCGAAGFSDLVLHQNNKALVDLPAFPSRFVYSFGDRIVHLLRVFKCRFTTRSYWCSILC
jgi:hypothetical protein